MADRQRIRAVPYSVELVSAAAYEDLIGQLDPAAIKPVERPSAKAAGKTGDAFLDAIHAPLPDVHLDASSSHNRMLTENLGVTLSSTRSPLVDLFYELEKSVRPDRLAVLLDQAWDEDPGSTLKLAFHARSIPNGKGERESFYRCFGWLVQRGHWRTVLRNLEALVSPLAPKPKPKTALARSDDDEVAAEGGEAELDAHNARSTGYYKDLANLLVLSAVGQLAVDGDMAIVPGCSALQNRKRGYTKLRTARFGVRVDEAVDEAAKDGRTQLVPAAAAGEEAGFDNEARNRAHSQKAGELRASDKDDQLASVTTLFDEPRTTFHRALHLTVARLFAAQLALDAEHLSRAERLASDGDQAGAERLFRKISLAAKWAPTPGRFHDRHAFLSPSIAEALDGGRSLGPNQSPSERESAFHGVMAAYRRKYLSPLRARLDVVERHLSSSELGRVRYAKVPSVAMSRYGPTFWEKDRDRFDAYLVRVAEGKASISGAALNPAQLVRHVRDAPSSATAAADGPGGVKRRVAGRMADLQWRAMVASVREGGRLESAIAVADVSGSMGRPTFADGTCPMDSSVGLAILLAQLAEPPFRDHVITFSAEPTFLRLEEGKALSDAVEMVERAEWGMNTDLVKAFRLILAKAVAAKVPPESMVKRIFVFSDMEWDAATSTGSYYSAYSTPARVTSWDTHYDILRREFVDAGYDLPELVFWNLAGGRTGIASKPVGKETPGTAMVSGYSGAMVKLFLEGGDLADEEGEDDEGGEWEKVDEGKGVEEGEGEPERKKMKMDPVSVMRKAIAHESFVGIKVYD